MLYTFIGSDRKRIKEGEQKLIRGLLARRPDASVFRLDETTFSADILEEYIGGIGLFTERHIVVLDGLLSNVETRNALEQRLKRLGTSKNVFIVTDVSLDAKTKHALESASGTVRVFGNKVLQEQPKEIFALADAMGMRDRMNAWQRYSALIRGGAVPEEIHGMLFWQAKCMLLASQTRSASEAGLKPFVFSKSKRYAANFTADELHDLSWRLVVLYHDAHRGRADFQTGLERLLLSVYVYVGPPTRNRT